MKLKIEDINDVKMEGLEVVPNRPEGWWKETYFDVYSFSEVMKEGMKMDFVRARKEHVIYKKMETHDVPETAFFLSGTAIMPLAKAVNGRIDMKSVRLVRIPAGTQIKLNVDLYHYLCYAETDEEVFVVFTFLPKKFLYLEMDEKVEADC